MRGSADDARRPAPATADSPTLADRYPAGELHIAEGFDALPDDIAHAVGIQ